MITGEVQKILEKHGAWLRGDKDGLRANLCNADLRGANLREVNLSEADLHGANLREVNLSEADLCGVDLSGADLREVDLSGANLHGANLREVNLSGANLHGANLREVDLSGADLCEVDLSGANLRGADLRGADLDFTCWPLWCGSEGVIVDIKIARQLAAHFCSVLCDDEDYKNARESILAFARGSHRASDLGLL